MSVCDHNCDECTCPFAYTEASAVAQNYGCLPTASEILIMRVKHGKTWACHSDPSKPCIGAIMYMKEHGLDYKVIDKELLDETSEWHLYAK